MLDKTRIASLFKGQHPETSIKNLFIRVQHGVIKKMPQKAQNLQLRN